jgi:uncharacterized Zn-binding protein involved in type VI secretion
MSLLLTTGTTIKCAFGTTPVKFIATSSPTVMVDGQPVGTIEDGTAVTNIPPFGMCTTLSNPAVASATAAALGVLTPQPCTPMTKAWVPEQSMVLSGGKPCLTQGCTCMCTYGGTITVIDPAQKTVTTV